MVVALDPLPVLPATTNLPLARKAQLWRAQARARARQIWTEINEVNLVENVLPTRGRARLVLTKSADHTVSRIRLRKI